MESAQVLPIEAAMFSETVQRILANPTHIGPLEGATHYGQAGVPGEGPFVELWLVVEGGAQEGRGKREEGREATVAGGLILQAAFRSNTCPSMVAAGCMAARVVTGMPVEKARLLTGEDLLLILGGLPEGKEECAYRVVLALRAALGS